MKVIAIALLVLFAYVSGLVPVRAADSCKDCRDYQRACVKAHSQAACKSEYDICMKHCKEK
jgi:hypothetical protein